MIWLTLPLAFALGVLVGKLHTFHLWNEEDAAYGRMRWMQGE